MKKLFVTIAVVVLLLSGSIALFAQSDEKGVVNLQRLSVPKVVGMLGGEAKSELKAVGLVGVYAGQMIPTSNVGLNAKVASQSPNAGSLVTRGATVTLTLYKVVDNAQQGDEKGVVNLPPR
jgi:hypothetical protein